jgi:hypothetical protein
MSVDANAIDPNHVTEFSRFKPKSRKRCHAA